MSSTAILANAEFTYQFSNYDGGDISAYSFASEAGYTCERRDVAPGVRRLR